MALVQHSPTKHPLSLPNHPGSLEVGRALWATGCPLDAYWRSGGAQRTQHGGIPPSLRLWVLRCDWDGGAGAGAHGAGV